MSSSLDPLDFFATLERSSGLCLVVFVKPGCGACRAMLAAIEGLELARPSLSAFVVDAEDGPGLIAEYEVFHFPALFLWRDGRYHARLQAEASPVALARAIAEARGRPPEDEP